MMSTISDLWNSGELPILDGLHHADGTSVAVRLAPEAPGGLRTGEAIDVDALVAADPDWVTTFDITFEVALPGESGDLLCCGEGSFGSEGFFARVDAERRLRWVVYLEHSNPFHDIAVEGGRATFRSTSGVTVTMGVDARGVPAAE
jgi:hypothetical protein